MRWRWEILMIHENVIDPHTKKITTVGARDLWQRILETRHENRRPCICFIRYFNKHIYVFKRKRFNH